MYSFHLSVMDVCPISFRSPASFVRYGTVASSLPTPDKMAEPQNDGLHTCYKSQFAPDSPVGGHGRGLPTCDPGHVFSKATSQAILETSQSAVYIYIYIYIYRRRGTVIWLRSLYMSTLGKVI